MNTLDLERYLDQVEQTLEIAQDALSSGSSSEVVESCQALKHIAVAFLQVADEMGRDALSVSPCAFRVKSLSDRMVPLMEMLLRQAAYVSQALQIVVPSEAWSTYNAKLGVNSMSQYGPAMRQSGTFKALAA